MPPSLKWSFSEGIWNRRRFISVDGNHFESGAFWKRWRHHNHVIRIGEDFKFVRRSVHGKRLMRFQRKTPFSSFTRVVCVYRAFMRYIELSLCFFSIFSSVPGTGGSQLQAKLNKPSVLHWYCSQTTSDYFTLWLKKSSLLPFAINCWVDNMR